MIQNVSCLALVALVFLPAPSRADNNDFKLCVELFCMQMRQKPRDYCERVYCGGLRKIEDGLAQLSSYQVCAVGCATSRQFDIPQCRRDCASHRKSADRLYDEEVSSCLKTGSRQETCAKQPLIRAAYPTEPPKRPSRRTPATS